jgi:hypothetical protein
MGLPRISRRGFLERIGLAGVAVAIAPKVLLPHEPAKYDRVGGTRTTVLDILRPIARKTLRYDIPDARVTELDRTGDARKFMIHMQGRSGLWVQKAVVVGSLATQLNKYGIQQEYAYQIAKRAREAARDIGEKEGIDWRANERGE